ncbi:MAG: hypothetical protein GY874_12230 [Desulfobacteraceae bacterium]|nr:hypothetical protein [Desulfobacteraceae bacterium]
MESKLTFTNLIIGFICFCIILIIISGFWIRHERNLRKRKKSLYEGLSDEIIGPPISTGEFKSLRYANYTIPSPFSNIPEAVKFMKSENPESDIESEKKEEHDEDNTSIACYMGVG